MKKEDVFEENKCVFIQCHIHLSKTLSMIVLCECYIIKKKVKYLIETFKSRLSQYDCSQISPCDFFNGNIY